ncbi:coiled-coil domain-containing protein 84 [Syngnathus typhle]|uniref:coiled-coil domain-containing protein 84 n=1 Tax=Syngnathus typhle TaxID=161592 RepID=UPI002A6B882D|nr:coiled-coil domain-containing protein 84 [Syngnathus typhle]
MGAYYCAICRQTAFNGKGHIFGKHHQSRLRLVLMKFIEKVKEARRTLNKPAVEKFDSAQHEKTFWCYCCGREVERNVTDGNMTVRHGGLLEHMATPEHRKSTHKFWWENKADPKLKDKVILTQEETQRFKAEVAKVLETFVEKEDEFIKQQAELIRAQEKGRQELLESRLEHEAAPESSNGPNAAETVTGAGVSFRGMTTWGARQHTARSLVHSTLNAQERGLTFIGHQDSSNGGNVHTGAVPPWLQNDDPLEGTSSNTAPPEIGPSAQGFLRQKEQEKLRKLPPNRVGANFDHSSHTDANWLPSFGRVWNSGRRWQSRHQFRQEEGQKNKAKRKMKQGGERSKKAKMTAND